MHITIESDKCCGAGNCVRRAPNVFDQDDEGVVVLLEAAPSGQMAEDAREAAALCPTWAIVTVASDLEVTA